MSTTITQDKFSPEGSTNAEGAPLPLKSLSAQRSQHDEVHPEVGTLELSPSLGRPGEFSISQEAKAPETPKAPFNRPFCLKRKSSISDHCRMSSKRRKVSYDEKRQHLLKSEPLIAADILTASDDSDLSALRKAPSLEPRKLEQIKAISLFDVSAKKVKEVNDEIDEVYQNIAELMQEPRNDVRLRIEGKLERLKFLQDRARNAVNGIKEFLVWVGAEGKTEQQAEMEQGDDEEETEEGEESGEDDKTRADAGSQEGEKSKGEGKSVKWKPELCWEKYEDKRMEREGEVRPGSGSESA